MAREYQTGKHLEAFILVLVAQEALHGGAIIARLKSILPEQWTIDDGQVYRLLRRLEADQAVMSTWQTPNEGAAIRVYQLTDKGVERLQSWREDITLRVRSLQTFLDLLDQSSIGPA